MLHHINDDKGHDLWDLQRRGVSGFEFPDLGMLLTGFHLANHGQWSICI